jgi:hypothetical protein
MQREPEKAGETSKDEERKHKPPLPPERPWHGSGHYLDFLAEDFTWLAFDLAGGLATSGFAVRGFAERRVMP